MTFEEGQTVWVRGTVVHGNEDWTAVKLSSDVACEAPDTLCVENEDLMAEADLASGITHVARDAYDPLHSYERYRLPDNVDTTICGHNVLRTSCQDCGPSCSRWCCL